MADSFVEVRRGSTIESRHHVHLAVVDADGNIRARSGDPELVAFARSAIKPLQALPLIEDGVSDHFKFSDTELAVCCASHNAESCHIDAARSILKKIGADEETLACGPHIPLGKNAAEILARSGREPTRIHNNCSGKHAGMLALARFFGWPLLGYQHHEHPVQQRMLAEVSRWTKIERDDIPLAVDGCGITTFALPVSAMAFAFAELAAGARRNDRAPACIVRAMTEHPEYVAGTERMCTDLMRVAEGRIFVKVGAEGVYCAGVPGAELGIALKIEDGATRAAEPALLGVLGMLGLLLDDEMAQLARYAEPDVRNTRGEIVGSIRVNLSLEAA